MSLRSIGVMNVLCSASTHRVRDVVALVLDLLDALGARFQVGRLLDHLQERPAALDGLLSLLLEVGEEGRVVRQAISWRAVYQSDDRETKQQLVLEEVLGLEGLDRL